MKILFDHPEPFQLAHGGFQIQIEQTRLALLQCGVQVEFLEWWNPLQKGDLIHYFGRPTDNYIGQAQGKGYKVVMGDLLTAVGSRSRGKLALERFCIHHARRFFPVVITWRMKWESYRLADACIALTDWEAHLMNYLFEAPKQRIHVVPNGVEEIFLNAPSEPRGSWLVCAATITERKRVLELGQAAVRAQTPLWVIGKAYAASDPYAKAFCGLAEKHPQIIRYEGPIQDRTRLARIYSQARGFVLLSAMETQSLAAEEAAACACPLLLSDLPWARCRFGGGATYCPLTKSVSRAARALRAFYDAAPTLPAPSKPVPWKEIGGRLKRIYQELSNGDRPTP